jgi:hypothetical protein
VDRVADHAEHRQRRDRQQRGRHRLPLVAPAERDQRGHDNQAAADAEHPGGRPGQQTDEHQAQPRRDVLLGLDRHPPTIRASAGRHRTRARPAPAASTP